MSSLSTTTSPDSKAPNQNDVPKAGPSTSRSQSQTDDGNDHQGLVKEGKMKFTPVTSEETSQERCHRTPSPPPKKVKSAGACKSAKKPQMGPPDKKMWKPLTTLVERKCPVCKYYFLRVVTHTVSAHCKGSAKFYCVFCNHSDTEEYLMFRHVRNSHRDQFTNTRPISDQPPELRVSGDDPYVDHCDMPMLEPETQSPE